MFNLPKFILYPLLVLLGILFGNGTLTVSMIIGAALTILVIFFALLIVAKILVGGN